MRRVLKRIMNIETKLKKIQTLLAELVDVDKEIQVFINISYQSIGYNICFSFGKSLGEKSNAVNGWSECQSPCPNDDGKVNFKNLKRRI